MYNCLLNLVDVSIIFRKIKDFVLKGDVAFMAKLFPPREIINKINQRANEGEKKLLDFMEKNLSDDFEVYFQPHLNGDLPDIVLVRRGYGVLIIEVKDYNLELYSPVSEQNWIVKSRKDGKIQYITSPIFQVQKYKYDFYDLFIDGLVETAIMDPRNWNIVQCAVFFASSSQDQITEFLNGSDNGNKKNGQIINNISYVKLFGEDQLTKEKFEHILNEKGFAKQNPLFTNDLYNKFSVVLQPMQHTLDQVERETHTFNAKQRKLIHSQANRMAKVKGVAGSGKTEVLANLAVNGFKRINKLNSDIKNYQCNEVLILTFNITLGNYIHDFISNVRENFPWCGFVIRHYHKFISMYWTKYLPDEPRPTDFEKRFIFPDVSSDKFQKKYEIILVDELQDFKVEWIQSIKKVLAENGEIVFFGDEKQNIYNRGDFEKNEKLPNTGIKGRWNFFTKNYRIKDNKLAAIPNAFQKDFFKNKYDYNHIAYFEQDVFAEKRYYFFHEMNAEKIVNIFEELAERLRLHPNDICFLGLSIKNVREVDQILRNKLNLHTTTTFEREEVYKNLENDVDRMKKLYYIRQSKKYNFWMGSGKVKLATVHSFKGWEAQTVFLIIDEDDMNKETGASISATDTNCYTECDELAVLDANKGKEKETINELIYTALTRVQKNLVVINIGNHKYDKFFRKNMDVSHQ